jgi:hypothetical protein
MATEILSRVLAVVVVAAFAVMVARGRLPIIPPGRWTVLGFAVAGLGMCTLAGTRDGIGSGDALPDWLSAVSAGPGIAAMTVSAAVVVGLQWRIGLAALAAVIAGNWLIVLSYAIASGSETAVSGAITLVVAVVVFGAITRPAIGSPLVQRPVS